jgi:vacuolar protein sorting-associated protein 35
MNLAHKCYQERVDMIDTVLSNTKELFAGADITVVEHRTPVGRELEKLLKIPVDSYNDLMVVLSLEHFIPLLNCYDYSGRKAMSAYLVNNVIDNNTLIPSPEKVETILTIVAPLVADQSDGPSAEQSRAEDREEWEEEQGLMGRLVHLLRAEASPDQQYLVLTAARKHFSAGGPLRLTHTLPPLVFEAYQLARRFHDVKDTDEKWDPKVEKIFKFCHSTISALVKAEMAELPLRMFLQGALACNAIPFGNHETVAYEYMSQAFSLYEDEISDSRAQLAAITLIIATFQQMSCFSEENHDPLRSQCALAAAKLLKKPDQCRGVLAVSHLFWSGASKATQGRPARDGKKVVDCLKKGLKIAKQCMDAGVQVQLLVEILNHYVLFYEAGNTTISVEMIQEIVSLVQGELGSLEQGEESEQIGQHFTNTLAHMRLRRDAEGSGLYQVEMIRFR